ncbi:MAG: hypothetical protein GQ469_09465 [Methanosarcinales archaeon]|nr:hypothetical protein [Methanosarcinales archaeon]
MIMRSKIIISVALLCMFLLTGSASAAVDFPADEAGISAYVKAKDVIDLNAAKPAFATIERETSDYIIGTVALSLHSEEQYPHVYVSTDGWIVAYYPNDRPASWLFPWYSYSGGSISTTTLADAVDIVVNQVGGNSEGLKYYDFKFQDATKMMLIVESTTSYNFFKTTVPSSFSLYEVGWSHYYPDTRYGGSATLDGTTFSSGLSILRYGNFGTSSEFAKGIEHTIEVSAGRGTGRVGLVLVYA